MRAVCRSELLDPDSEDAVDRFQVRRLLWRERRLVAMLSTTCSCVTLRFPPPSSERLRCRQAAQELTSEEGRHMWRVLDEDQLVLHYQPLVSLADGRLHGFKAPLRWNDPDQGPVPAADFVPVAEDTELIVQLGQWVMRKALKQLQTWNENADLEAGLAMSVNVSARQFGHPDMVDKVREVLRETGVPGSQLHLEITESVIDGRYRCYRPRAAASARRGWRTRC